MPAPPQAPFSICSLRPVPAAVDAPRVSPTEWNLRLQNLDSSLRQLSLVLVDLPAPLWGTTPCVLLPDLDVYLSVTSTDIFLRIPRVCILGPRLFSRKSPMASSSPSVRVLSFLSQATSPVIIGGSCLTNASKSLTLYDQYTG